MTVRNTFFTLTLILCFCFPALAQEQPENPRDIEFEADQVDYDESQKRIRLVGNVIITSDGSKLSAPYAVYYTEKAVC